MKFLSSVDVSAKVFLTVEIDGDVSPELAAKIAQQAGEGHGGAELFHLGVAETYYDWDEKYEGKSYHVTVEVDNYSYDDTFSKSWSEVD